MHYMGFNGQFANLYYGVGKGVFIGSQAVLLKHILGKICLKPVLLISMVAKNVVTDPEVFSANDEAEKTA
jgi:5-bromo-4-chloroindolyl phosphate hydrolysis protein